MKYTAKQKGFYGDRIVQAGETFEARDDLQCKWAVKAADFKDETVVKTAEQLQKDATEGSQGKRKEKAIAKAPEFIDEAPEKKPAPKPKSTKKAAPKKSSKKE